MKKLLTAIIFLLALIPSVAAASKHVFVCSDWNFAAATGASCSSGIITLSAATGNISDGVRNGATNSGFVETAGVTYFYQIVSNTGSGSNNVYIIGNAAQASKPWSLGVTTNTSIVAPSGNTVNQTLLEVVGGTTGTINYVCVSSVSNADCNQPSAASFNFWGFLPF